MAAEFEEVCDMYNSRKKTAETLSGFMEEVCVQFVIWLPKGILYVSLNEILEVRDTCVLE